MALGDVIARNLFIVHSLVAARIQRAEFLISPEQAQTIGKASDDLLSYLGIELSEGQVIVSNWLSAMGAVYVPMGIAFANRPKSAPAQPSAAPFDPGIPAGGVVVTPGGITLAA